MYLNNFEEFINEAGLKRTKQQEKLSKEVVDITKQIIQPTTFNIKTESDYINIIKRICKENNVTINIKKPIHLDDDGVRNNYNCDLVYKETKLNNFVISFDYGDPSFNDNGGTTATFYNNYTPSWFVKALKDYTKKNKIKTFYIIEFNKDIDYKQYSDLIMFQIDFLHNELFK